MADTMTSFKKHPKNIALYHEYPHYIDHYIMNHRDIGDGQQLGSLVQSFSPSWVILRVLLWEL